MHKEDSLQFAQERLRQHHVPSSFSRELGLWAKPQVKRRLAAQLAKGEARTFDRVNESVVVCCSRGSLWITHDGDPKDVILSAGESHQAERDQAMHVFAMQDCILEIEFEDVVLDP